MKITKINISNRRSNIGHLHFYCKLKSLYWRDRDGDYSYKEHSDSMINIEYTEWGVFNGCRFNRKRLK